MIGLESLYFLLIGFLSSNRAVCYGKVYNRTITQTNHNKNWILNETVTNLIIKITISSLVIGLKEAYFPLIRLPSCYRTVCYWIVCYWTVCYRTVQKTNHIQRCSLKQPITFKVVITCACACACFCFCFFFFLGLLLYFNANFPLFSQLGYFSRKL